MAGPIAAVLLRDKLTAAQLARIEADLKNISSELVKHSTQNWQFWVTTTRPLGGNYSGEGGPFGLEPSELELEWEEVELSVLASRFGFRPQECLGLWAGCNDDQDHRILGELTFHLASLLNGLIDFGGALLPPLPRSMDPFRSDWMEIKSQFKEMVSWMPGLVVGLEYETLSGRTWVRHVGDPPFMEAWLRHPNFRMVK